MPRRMVLLLVAALMVQGACRSGHKSAGPGPSGSAAAATTTTTLPPTWPLTGLPAPDANAAKRPALVVKIDNGRPARPQAGLNQADVVVEEQVEGGVTRFFTIFHSTDADPVGPVRSARSTDVALVSALHRPLFAYAGTNAAFQRLIDAAPLVNLSYEGPAGKDYRRQGGRPAPYNLFSSTPALFRRAPADAQPPPPLFPFRPGGGPLTTAGATPAARVHLEFRNGPRVMTTVDYTWDAGAGTWRRNQDGGPHNDAGGAQISPKNVVVQFTDYRDSGQRDPAGSVVPEAQLVGQGEAWVLSDGKVVKGRWSKPAPDSVTTYTDAQGNPVPLTPGQTWVELPQPGTATVG